MTRVADAYGRDIKAAPGDHLGGDKEEINELILALFPDYRSYINHDLDGGPITDAGEEHILNLDHE